MKLIRIFSTNLTLGFALATGQAGAESITVNNANFETPPLATGGQFDSSNPSFFSTTGWNGTPAAGNIGIYDPHPGAWEPGFAPGSNVAYMCCAPFSGTLWQKTGNVLEKGNYTLGVDVAYPKAANPWPTDVRLRLYAGNDPTTGVLLKEASQSIPASPGIFERRTLTFGTNDLNWAALFAANQLKPLTIAFFTTPHSSGAEADFDNVTFDWVPEPASAGLIGLSGLLLFLRRR